MVVSDNIITAEFEEEFRVCQVCGYERGFHVSFVRAEKGYDVTLICPECGQRYQVGMSVKLR